MEDVQSRLIDLGYDEAQDIEILKQAFIDGSPNMVFVDIVTWLSSQIVPLCDLESCVSPVTADEYDLGGKPIAFLVEISSLLKELCCPIKRLTRGAIESRLTEPADKIVTIVYLCSELEAAKILAHKKPKKNETLQIELAESKTAKELREMLISLRFGKPPDTITPVQLFSEVEKKVKALSNPLPPKDVVGELLFSGYLTEKQWFQLQKLFQELFQEYKTRRSLLLRRLDVTIKSFLWAERLKSKSEEIINMYDRKKSLIEDDPAVKISDVLSAKADLTIIEKTSSASVRKNTKCSVNIIVIGAVPDRGGRPEEQQPPPPEVPSWQKNEPASRGGMRSSQQSSSKYRNTGRNDENSDLRSPTDSYKAGNFGSNRISHNAGRGDYFTPSYQPVQYCGQLGNPQLGFGGYLPAGDNFQQFGMNDGLNQYNPRPMRGSGPRQRGSFDRGANSGRRPYRGRGRY